MGFVMAFERKEGENVYAGAEFVTKGFILRAPKVRLDETTSFVKITILEKIRS